MSILKKIMKKVTKKKTVNMKEFQQKGYKSGLSK